jgi:hypothetical protein
MTEVRCQTRDYDFWCLASDVRLLTSDLWLLTNKTKIWKKDI